MSQVSTMLTKVNITEIVVHEADEPDGGADLLASDGLTGERSAEIDFLRCRLEERTLQPLENPFGPRVLPMS